MPFIVTSYQYFLKPLVAMLYETKQNDGSTPYYLPRIELYTYKWTTENGMKRAQRPRVNDIHFNF